MSERPQRGAIERVIRRGKRQRRRILAGSSASRNTNFMLDSGETLLFLGVNRSSLAGRASVAVFSVSTAGAAPGDFKNLEEISLAVLLSDAEPGRRTFSPCSHEQVELLERTPEVSGDVVRFARTGFIACYPLLITS